MPKMEELNLLEARKKLLLSDMLDLMEDIKDAKSAERIQILLRHFTITIGQHIDEIKTVYKTS